MCTEITDAENGARILALLAVLRADDNSAFGESSPEARYLRADKTEEKQDVG